MLYRSLSVTALSLLVAITFAQTTTINQDVCEKTVRELESHAIKNPDYEYPIKVEFSNDDVLNAYAHLTRSDKEGGKPRATVTIFKKFTEFMGSDLRLIRAVLAHEISHLTKGHISHKFAPADLELIHTRQQELDADATGAALLQSCGYDKKDMVDFLNFAEDKLRGKNGWLGESMSDHPSFQARIANIQDNPLVAQSLAEFDYGLMFMDSRMYVPAARAFDRSIKKQPDFVPAYVDKAQAKLAYYYETQLPRDLRDAWFRADFGGTLANRSTTIRGTGDLTDARKAYRAAIDSINESLAKDKQNPRALELQALALVLDPDGDASNLQTGSDYLSKLATTAPSVMDKLRAANNAALGLQRQGKSSQAVSMLLAAQMNAKNGDQFSVTLIMASNISRTKVEDVPADNSSIAASVTRYYLVNTSDKEPHWNDAKTFYSALCAKNNFKPEDITPAPIIYSAPLSLTHKGDTLELLTPIDEFIQKYGKATTGTKYDDLYPDMLELVWDSELSIITAEGHILRLTSYSPTASLTLKSVRANDDTQIVIKVGMTKDEVKALFNLDSGVSVNLVKGGEMQQWTYFADQNFGLLFSDGGKVSGITVAPASIG